METAWPSSGSRGAHLDPVGARSRRCRVGDYEMLPLGRRLPRRRGRTIAGAIASALPRGRERLSSGHRAGLGRAQGAERPLVAAQGAGSRAESVGIRNRVWRRRIAGPSQWRGDSSARTSGPLLPHQVGGADVQRCLVTSGQRIPARQALVLIGRGSYPSSHHRGSFLETVGPVGLEPTTRGLKVRCSTN